ncbi:TPA: glycosyltransferase [Vibrio cholerae]|nr:glycosyltransferase family 4 protein [Vibrio cholerae]HDL9439099.1 glycosyltransferase [Vibrio cholerae]
MKVVSLYSGNLYSPTGVATVIKELDQADWSSFGKIHTVFCLDEKEHYNEKIVVFETKSTKKRLSSIRKKLWALSEKYSLIALLYLYFFHMYRANKLINELRIKTEYRNHNYIIHDLWSLICLAKENVNLEQCIFVNHGSVTPVKFIETIFPSLKGSLILSYAIERKLKNILPKVKEVILLSENRKKELISELGRDCKVIMNGMSDIVRHKMNDNRSMTIHITGNICSRKRQYLIPYIASNLKKLTKHDFKINIFGGGELNEIKSVLNDLNINCHVELHGNVSNPSNYYFPGDIILCISTEEGLPMALIEGIRSGCIPITVNVGGCKEVISNHNGFLLDSIDDELLVEEVANKIAKITESDKMRMSLLSVELFKTKFSSEAMVRKYAEVF